MHADVLHFMQKCVTAFGKNYHLEHFRCAACDAPVGDDRYYEKDGKAYCRYCNMAV